MTQTYVPRRTPQPGERDYWGDPNAMPDPTKPMAMTGGPAMAAPQAGTGSMPNRGYGDTGSTYNPTTNRYQPGTPQAPTPVGTTTAMNLPKPPSWVPPGSQLAAMYNPGYYQQVNLATAAGKMPWQQGQGQQGGTTGGYGQGGGQQTQGDPGLNAFMDRGPYNSLVDRGNQFIRNGIPTNASNLTDSSPAFRGMNPGMSQSLNQQWNDRGRDLQNQAGLEFGRQAGVQIPQFLLQQMLGVKGLENDWFNLQNDQYRTNTNQQSGGINQILKLLGGMGNLF